MMTFLDFLTENASNLSEIHISHCSQVTIQCLVFLARCTKLLVVTLPKRFSQDSNNIEAFVLQRQYSLSMNDIQRQTF
jgi:hypothetical protein